MLSNIRLQRLSNVKHSNLLIQFVSYEGKEVLLLWPQVPEQGDQIGRKFAIWAIYYGIVNLTKTWLGDFLGYFSLSLGDFLTKTSGHSAHVLLLQATGIFALTITDGNTA